MWLLGIASVLLLVIVCVNLGTLLLTRGAARREELAIRLAVGGSRVRVVRQLVTESVVLAVTGLIVGLGLALVATRVLASTLPLSMPTTLPGTDLTRLSFLGVALNGRAIGFAALLGIGIGVGVGLLSALRVARPAIVTTLRQGGSSAGRDGALARSALVAVQVALALAFLAASGLTLESFRRTLDVALGFRPDHLLTVNVTLDPIRARTEPTSALWRGVVDEIRDVPGVRDVALGECSPVGDHCNGTSLEVPGHAGSTHVMVASAAPGYFAALGTRLLRGRDFRPADDTGADRVAIINEAAERLAWGGEDPLVAVVGCCGRVRVVGVVADARYGDVEQPPRPAVFVPFSGRRRGVVFIRTNRDPASLIVPVRAAIRRAGRGHAPGAVQTMRAQLRDATARNRLGAQVFSGFALGALLLAAIGVYGTAALSVLQRSRELAIRRALGASPASLIRAVSRPTVIVAVIGIIAGLALAVLVNHRLGGVLYNVRPLEPRVYLLAAAVLFGAMAAACVVPTMRSVTVDPREAMKAE